MSLHNNFHFIMFIRKTFHDFTNNYFKIDFAIQTFFLVIANF